MNRKKTLLGLGILYSICGITAGAVCYGQETDTAEAVTLVSEDSGQTAETPPESEEQTQTEEATVEETQTQTEEVPSESEESTQQEETQEEPIHYMATAVDVGRGYRLHIRDAGSMQGTIIGYMRDGDVVDVLEVGEEWHHVVFKDIEGYVSARYLELTPIQEEDVSEEIGVEQSE